MILHVALSPHSRDETSFTNRSNVLQRRQPVSNYFCGFEIKGAKVNRYRSLICLRNQKYVKIKLCPCVGRGDKLGTYISSENCREATHTRKPTAGNR
jgi:hypothetical protein